MQYWFFVLFKKPKSCRKYITLSPAIISSSVEASMIKVLSRNTISLTINKTNDRIRNWYNWPFHWNLAKFSGFWVQGNWNINISEVNFAQIIPFLKNFLQKEETFYFETFVWYVFLINFLKFIIRRCPISFFGTKNIEPRNWFGLDEIVLTAPFCRLSLNHLIHLEKASSFSIFTGGGKQFRTVSKKMESDRPEIDLEWDDRLLFSPSPYKNALALLLLGDYPGMLSALVIKCFVARSISRNNTRLRIFTLC